MQEVGVLYRLKTGEDDSFVNFLRSHGLICEFYVPDPDGDAFYDIRYSNGTVASTLTIKEQDSLIIVKRGSGLEKLAKEYMKSSPSD